jgi:TetR/AcrR family transcriptional regulator, transcriptional repressor for nem operon
MNLRETIIFESMKLFSLKGFMSTSINDILEACKTSKGGFYNHFSSKEELFLTVLAEAQRIWRDRVLYGLDDINKPTDKIIKLLENYRDRYLQDSDNFPGGCFFVALSVELDDIRPELVQEVNKGFVGLKRMLKRLLEEGKESGELSQGVDTNRTTELIFSGMIGSSVLFGVEKSKGTLDRSLNALIDYLTELRKQSLPG